MADDLASLISGTDPLAPVELRAYQQQQLLNSARDASQWANQGPFGALARTIAGFSGGPAQNTVAQIAAARAQNNPQLFQALASGNPIGWGANTANNASPLTLSGILANYPSLSKANLETAGAQNIWNTLRSFGVNPGATTPTSPAPLSPAAARPNQPVAPPSTNGPLSTAPPASTPLDTGVSGVLPMPTTAAGLADWQAIARVPPGQRSRWLADPNNRATLARSIAPPSQ